MREREIEIFEVNTGYEMLVQVLDIERGEKSDLHCEIDINDYFDVVRNVVEEYDDKITYLMLTKNTDGNRTKITNVDGLYEIMGDKYVVNYYVNIINESSHYNNNYNVIL